MVQLAREELFSPNEVACVHVMNRAVRRCFLLGNDPITGKNFDHRKRWLESKLEQLAAYMGIDLLGSAILSNHFHLILRSRPDVVSTWSDAEVARRWCLLCPRRKNEDGSPKEPSQPEINSIQNDPDKLREVRRRLSDISWWMRLLCQHVGQRANRETQETGKFWESRFRAVRLLDDSAILSCAAYVDLNPIRAGLAKTIEDSDFTSAKKRLEALLTEATISSSAGKQSSKAANTTLRSDRALSPVHIDELRSAIGPQSSDLGTRCSEKGFLNMSAAQYLTLLDWTARELVRGKAGSTPADTPPILTSVGLEPKSWLKVVASFGTLFHHVAGLPHEISRTLSRRSKRRFRVRAKLQEAFS